MLKYVSAYFTGWVVKFLTPYAQKIAELLKRHDSQNTGTGLSSGSFGLSWKQTSWEEAHLGHVFMPLWATVRKKQPVKWKLKTLIFV